MAVLKTVSGEEIEVTDGASLRDAADQLGIPIACGVGICGSCKVQVVSGRENLEAKTDNEASICEDNERCMCQAKIKEGEVVIDF